MRDVVDRGIERLEAVEGRYVAVLFFAGLLAYTAALVVEARGYNADARLFPIIVGVPLAALLVANIVLHLLADRIDLRLVGFFDDVGGFELPDEPEVDHGRRLRRELDMVGWVALLAVLTWLVGNYVAIVAFVFAFIAVHERDLARALLVTAVTFVLVYGLFDVVLGARLWRGVVPLGGFLP